MTSQDDKRPAAIGLVLPFALEHWLKQPVRATIILVGFLGATVADLFMPVYSGRLVDALTSVPSDQAARHAALIAFAGILALGLLSIMLRFTGLRAIVPFTLQTMSDVARGAFFAREQGQTHLLDDAICGYPGGEQRATSADQAGREVFVSGHDAPDPRDPAPPHREHEAHSLVLWRKRVREGEQTDYETA